MPDHDGAAPTVGGAWQAVLEPVEWEVRPAGIEQTRFADPSSFYLSIRRGTWQNQTTWVVSPANASMGFTRRGKLVWLRHDVNAKHAHQPSFEEAARLARAIADGDLRCEEYRTWRQAEAARFGTATGDASPAS